MRPGGSPLAAAALQLALEAAEQPLDATMSPDAIGTEVNLPRPAPGMSEASIFVATLVGILLLRKLLDFMGEKRKERVNTVLKVLFVFSQVLVQFPSIFGVRFPTIFAGVLEWLSVPTLSFSFTTGTEW